jgi:hypothetical protein
MDKLTEIKNLNDNSLLEEKANLETKENISQDTNLESFYFNLLNDTEIKIPKMIGTENIFKLLEFILNKTFEEKEKEVPDIRKKQVLNLLIAELVDNINSDRENFSEKLNQFFSFKNFFETFFEIILKKEDLSLFKDKFFNVSKVSLYLLIYIFFFIDNSTDFKR